MPHQPIQVSERMRRFLAARYAAAPKCIRGAILADWAARLGLTKQALLHRIYPYLETRHD